MKPDFKTLDEFLTFFKDEATCRAFFEAIRFSEGDYCPHCKHDKIMRFSDGKRLRCHKCRKDFTIKTKTLFGESKLPLKKWFIAIYLLTSSKKGISSIELSKLVGVSQKTGWFMDHRIREAMKQGKGKLFGTVEVDETYLGGKHKHRDGMTRKSAVMGMKARGGEIKAYPIKARELQIVMGNIKENIDKKALIMTDEARVYMMLPGFGYKHKSINHSREQWVKGNIHTNSIESFWALFKRGYHGTYHVMSKKHLQRYLNEFTYRLNRSSWDIQEVFEDVVSKISKSGRMGYKKLTYAPTSKEAQAY